MVIDIPDCNPLFLSGSWSCDYCLGNKALEAPVSSQKTQKREVLLEKANKIFSQGKNGHDVL